MRSSVLRPETTQTSYSTTLYSLCKIYLRKQIENTIFKNFKGLFLKLWFFERVTSVAQKPLARFQWNLYSLLKI